MEFEVYKPHKVEEEEKSFPTKRDSRWKKLIQLIEGMQNQESPKVDVKIEQQVEYLPAQQKEQQEKQQVVQEFDLKDQKPLQVDPENKSTSVYQNARQYYSNKKADDNAELAYKYFTEKWKMSPIMASGIIGNLYHENLANPTQTVDDSRGTTAFGVASLNSRGLLSDYLGYIQERKLNKEDLYSQLDYIADYILHGKDPNLTREMNRPDLTPELASFAFGRYFEKFAGRDGTGRGYNNYDDDEHRRRRDSAVKIYNKYNKAV